MSDVTEDTVVPTKKPTEAARTAGPSAYPAAKKVRAIRASKIPGCPFPLVQDIEGVNRYMLQERLIYFSEGGE